MKAIVAVDKNWGIGRDNNLLFSIPQDMKFFRQTTLNKVVVMGANTLKSFPNSNPLKNRINIVLSTKIKREDCVCVNSLDKLLTKLLDYESDDIFIIGGAKIYSQLLDYCDEIFVTKVDADGKADVFFPNLDEINTWQLVEKSERKEDNGYFFEFLKYKNNKVEKV